METRTPQQVQEVTSADEVQIRTRRPDGSLRRPRTTWIVHAGSFRHALAVETGQVVVRGATYEVVFAEADAADLDRVDAVCREECHGHASIVDHLQSSGPRAATLQVLPAGQD